MIKNTDNNCLFAFQNIGQDTIPLQDTTHATSRVIRKPRVVITQQIQQPPAKPLDTTIVENGYDPDRPDFTQIIARKKEIWDVLHKTVDKPVKEIYHYTPVFNPDTLASVDSSAIAYKNYISSVDANANRIMKNNSVQGIETEWMFGIIVLSLLLLTWVRLFFNKYLIQIIGSLINYQLSFKLLRDRNVLYARISVLLNGVFIISLGLFLYIVLQHFDSHLFSFSGFINFLLYCALIAVASILQVFVLKILGTVFLRTREFNEYIHNIFISNKGTGLFLLPLVICIPYISEFFINPLIYIGLGIIIILYLWRFVRGYKIIVSKDISKFYLILYFCTLEILPVLLIYKFLQNTVDSGGF